ncbi:STE like transcription factor-domain-containing protein [Irpex rosettiformis]|uniref:STE like transcription factor-domain-containing protein n=1 Tax=Irpex rosettiformis TaxID=378272 RepID=A0ACB8TQS8_9APHY|nr:STE like transcription factor-domain-containing protein [Irpex rosettiformis]
MTTLLAHHPHQLTMDSSPFSAHSSGSSIPRASHPYAEDYAYPYHTQRYASPHHLSGQLLDPNSRLSAPSSLQISTDTPASQDQEVDEQTAHPSRMQSQLQRIETPDMQTLAETEPQASGSMSRRGSPSPSASHDGSVNNLTSFGNFEDSLSRPLSLKERELLAHLDRLKFFLATAPSRWTMEGGEPSVGDCNALPVGHPNSAHPALNRFLLPNSEYVSCVLWGGLYHITGTDIVRALVFRFEAFGRPVKNMKKFEEGVFSDLRNLKPGVDACLEEPKSPFLDLLFKYQCIRTQKKQKVFYWFSVPHDRLFLDALERDLKREKMGAEPTTAITGEPAMSFTYDPKRSLYDQFSKATGVGEGESELEAAVRRADEARSSDTDTEDYSGASLSDAELSSSEVDEAGRASDVEGPNGSSSSSTSLRQPKPKSALHGPNSPFFPMFSLFEGSPTYKQRRKKIPKHRSPSAMEVYNGNTNGAPESAAADYYGGMPGANVLTRTAANEPQIDRYGRDIARLSAADMFMAQARGDFGPQSNPDLIASQKERQRRAMQAGQLAGKGYFGSSGISGYEGGPPRHASVPYPQHQHQHPGLRASPEAVGGVYPPGPSPLGLGLEHDGRRPRVEQRHTYPMMAMPPEHGMRTNTQPFDAQIRPGSGGPWPATGAEQVGLPRMKAYVCPLFSCGRMFKLEDQLKRHLRTHTVERPFGCQRCRKRFAQQESLNVHMRAHQHADEGAVSMADEADVESEGEFGGNGFGGISDTAVCAVEIQGEVQEVHGSEEGLLMPASNLVHPIPINAPVDEFQEIYQPDNSGIVQPSPEHGQYLQDSPNQWNMLRSAPSPAFSTISMPSPNLSASYPAVNDFTSLSAPAHKAAFDHANIYPPPLGELTGGPGPIRRHRSATPSMRGYNETARRSYTEVSAPRSYHPYAITAHSADSSPMTSSLFVLSFTPFHTIAS